MYVDVLLCENLIINFFLLYITSRFSRFKTSNIRLSIGAGVGALYILVIFFPSLKIFLSMPIKAAVSALMVIIAFAPARFKDIIKIMGIFYIITFAFGGAAFSLVYLAGIGEIVNGVFFIEMFPLSLLLMSFAIGYILLIYCWDYIQNRILNDDIMYKITIIIDGKHAEVNGILDTGNSLKDPISKYPVIVAEYEALGSILPDTLNTVFVTDSQDIDLNQIYKYADCSGLACRIRIIPFSSLGKNGGILIGIKPDIVKIVSKKYTRDINKVIIGVCKNRLSNEGHYNALVSPEILK